MRRAGLAAAAAVMAVAGLTGCSGGNEEFCEVGQDLESADMSSPSKLSDVMDEAVDKAPDEIKGDVETLRDGVEAAEAAQENPEEADMGALKDSQEAATNVQDWVSENCE